MPAHHRVPADTSMPEAFTEAANAIKTEVNAKRPHPFGSDLRKQRSAAIDQMLQSKDVAFHAGKALRFSGGLETLCTMVEVAMDLPEHLATADARSPSEKHQYLEAVQTSINDIIVLLDQDRPSTSELAAKKPTPGQWPPHPFYRTSLLEGLATKQFRLDRYLDVVGPDGATCAGGKAKLRLSTLHGLLGLVEKSLIQAIALAKAEMSPRKGNGALRAAVYEMDDSLGQHAAFFADNPRRISRNGLIAAFVKAACSDLFDFNATQLTQKEVSGILKDRERHRRANLSAEHSQIKESGPIS